MTPRPNYVIAAMATAALCLASLAGCGGDNTTSAPLTPDASGSPATSATTPAPSSTSPTPTTPATPPGKTVAITKASLIVPRNWDVEPGHDDTTFGKNDQGISCDLGETPGLPEKRATKKLLDRLIREGGTADGPVHRDPNLTVNGVLLSHIDTKQENITYTDTYETVNDGYLVDVSCLSEIGLVSHRQALKEFTRFMATFRLR